MGQTKTCIPVIGTVDNHLGVSPLTTHVGSKIYIDTKLIITSKPLWFFRVPILRRVARIGILVNPLKDTVQSLSAFRVILQTDGPVAIRMLKKIYHGTVNIMGGKLFMFQTLYDCIIFEDFGVFLGVVEYQFKSDIPKKLKIKFTVQTGMGSGAEEDFELELR